MSRSLTRSCDKLKTLCLHYHDAYDQHEWVPPIKSHEPWIKGSCEVTWLNETIISPLPQCLWRPKFAEVWLTMRVPTHKVTWSYNQVVCWDHVTNQNHYISTTTKRVAAKLGRVGIYDLKLPFITSCNPLITCSFQVTRIIRSVISLPQQGLWPPKLGRWWLIRRNFHPQSYTTLWTRDEATW